MGKFSEILEKVGFSAEEQNAAKKRIEKTVFTLATTRADGEDVKKFFSDIKADAGEVATEVKVWDEKMVAQAKTSIKTATEEAEAKKDKIVLCAKMRKAAEKVGWSEKQARDLALIYYQEGAESPSSAKQTEEYLKLFFESRYNDYQVLSEKEGEEKACYSKIEMTVKNQK